MAKLNPLNWAATERALEWWDERAPREQLLLAFTVVAIVLFVGWLGSRFMGASLTAAQQRRDLAESSLNQVKLMYADYLKRNAEVTARREEIAKHGNFSVAGFLERLAKEQGLDEQIGNLNDKGVQTADPYNLHVVDVRFSKISLADLTKLLYRIEAEEAPLRVTDIRAKTNTRERSEITVTMTVAMLKLKDGVAPVEQ